MGRKFENMEKVLQIEPLKLCFMSGLFWKELVTSEEQIFFLAETPRKVVKEANIYYSIVVTNQNEIISGRIKGR